MSQCSERVLGNEARLEYNRDQPGSTVKLVPRWALLLLLVVAVVCAGVGMALLVTPTGAASFGWAAYAPLSPSDNGRYLPVDLTWLQWRPWVGATLLALGAGTTGAVLAVWVTRRFREPSHSVVDRSAA